MSLRPWTLFAAALAAIPAGPARAAETVVHPFVGVTWKSRVQTDPRPLRMHVVDIDLAAPGLRFRLTPHEPPLHTRKETTLDFLTRQRAQIAVNSHFFEPWPPPSPDPGTASLVGIAASDGRVYAPFLDKPPKPYAIGANAPGLNIDAANRASIVHRSAADANGYAAAEPVMLYNTLSGNEQIVTAGRVTVAGISWNDQLAPRTAVGLTNNQHLILFVVDGRQKGTSEGMSVHEVAELLVRDFGVVDAIGLDGGGSATLAMADPSPRIVNVPVGVKDVPGTQRAVGSNLAIFALAREPSSTTSTSPAAAPGKPSSNRLAQSWPFVAAGTCLAAGLVLVLWRRRGRRSR